MHGSFDYSFRTSFFVRILILIAVLFSTTTLGKCKEFSFSVMPPPGDVPANTRFLIEGFGSGQVKVESLKSGEAVLVSSQSRIALIPEHLYIGQYLVSQITLKPAEPLMQGIRYTLSVAGIDPADMFSSGDTSSKGWISNGAIDIEKPTWTSTPVLLDRKTINRGNDPAEWIQVSAPVSDENHCYILVQLKNQIETDYARSYLIPIKRGMIKVGHGVCSGPFNINSGYQYTALLIPCDIAGNCNTAAGRTLHFSDMPEP